MAAPRRPLTPFPFATSVAINAGGTLQLGQRSQIDDDITGFALEFGASQTLTSLTIGSGAVVRLAQSPPGGAPESGFVNDQSTDNGPLAVADAPAQAAPEPGTLSLLAIGAIGPLGRRRRRALR